MCENETLTQDYDTQNAQLSPFDLFGLFGFFFSFLKIHKYSKKTIYIYIYKRGTKFETVLEESVVFVRKR